MTGGQFYCRDENNFVSDDENVFIECDGDIILNILLRVIMVQ